jgi:hypothetical protein
MSQYLQVRERSGLVRDCPCPNIYMSGIAPDGSGIACPNIYSSGIAHDGSGIAKVCQSPNFCGSGIARDWSGIAPRDWSEIAHVPTFTGPGLFGIAPGLPMSQYLQVRDYSGLLQDCTCPKIYRSGIARDCSGIADCLCPNIYRSGIGRDCSWIAKAPVFAGPGLLGIGPGLPMSQYLQVRDCSGLVRDCPCPNIYRSGIARDCSGIAHIPIFTCPGLLGIGLGLPMSQYLQVRDCSGLLRDCPCPNIYRSGIAPDGSGIACVPIFTGPGLLMMAPGLPTSQFLQVRDWSGLVRDCSCPNIYRSGIGRDWSGIAQVPIFTGPGLLRDCLCPIIYRSGIAPDGSGIAHVLIFTGPGLLGIAPGSQSPIIYRSGITHPVWLL